MIWRKNRPKVEPCKRLVNQHKESGLPECEAAKHQGKVKPEMHNHQAPFDDLIFRSFAQQKFDAIILEPEGYSHQRGQKDKRLMLDQKASELADAFQILFPCKFQERNLNIGVHIHLIRMAMMSIMLLQPPAITHPNQ